MSHRLKVLHIWDLAGVANIIAKFMDRHHDTKSHVMSLEAFDTFGQNIYTKPLTCGVRRLKVKALFEARKHDIVHVHSLDNKMVRLLKIIYRKPVVISYYGSDIRNKWKERQKQWSRADLILYSTKDLRTDETPKKATWLACPIDTDLFYPKPLKKRGTALTLGYGADDLANQYALEKGLTLTVIKRSMPYKKMGDLLSQYEYYIDVKRKDGQVIEAISKTGLEALACGRKVIGWEKQIVTELPQENRPENVVRKLYSLYQDLLAT